MLESFADGCMGAMEIAAREFFLEGSGAGGNAVEFDGGTGRSTGDFEGLRGERDGCAKQEYGEVEETKSEAGTHERLPGCLVYS